MNTEVVQEFIYYKCDLFYFWYFFTPLICQIVAQYILSAPTESACARIQTIKSSIDDQHDCTVGEKK